MTIFAKEETVCANLPKKLHSLYLQKMYKGRPAAFLSTKMCTVSYTTIFTVIFTFSLQSLIFTRNMKWCVNSRYIIYLSVQYITNIFPMCVLFSLKTRQWNKSTLFHRWLLHPNRFYNLLILYIHSIKLSNYKWKKSVWAFENGCIIIKKKIQKVFFFFFLFLWIWT